MNFQTLTKANKKSSLVISVKKPQTWIDSTSIDNDVWIYHADVSSISRSADGSQLMFHDVIEKQDVVLSREDENNITQVAGCVHDEDSQKITNVNDRFSATCDNIITRVDGMTLDNNTFQYVKRQLNIQRVVLYQTLGDFLSFTKVATGQMSEDELEQVRQFWLQQIKTHQQKSLKYLHVELQAAEQAEEQEIVDEINKIIDLVDDVIVQATEHLNKLKKFDHVVKYWPNLLLPAPDFVVK